MLILKCRALTFITTYVDLGYRFSIFLKYNLDLKCSHIYILLILVLSVFCFLES